MMNTLKTEQYQEARDRLDTLDTVLHSALVSLINGKMGNCVILISPHRVEF